MKNYLELLDKWSSFFAPALAILGVVAAFTFLDYFNSNAEIDFDIEYISVTYDEDGIIEDFIRYDVHIPDTIFASRGLRVKMISKKTDFKSRQEVETDLLASKTIGKVDEYNELLDGIVYSFQEHAATVRDLPNGHATNRAFWETYFPAAIDKVVDTVTFHQALRIVIARRHVTVLLSVSNAGSAPAKAIQVTLQRPYLLKPRHIINLAEMEYLKIESEQPICQISNAKSHATISIPFIEKEEAYLFYITTTMTNVTKDNVIIDYTSYRSVDSVRIAVSSVICIVSYYFLALVWLALRKFKLREK